MTAGVYVTEAVQTEPPPLGEQLVPVMPDSAPFAGVLAIANVSEAVSVSDAESVIVFAVFLGVVTDCPLAVGAWLTAVTVMERVAGALAGAMPSLTVNVMLSEPVKLVLGV